MEIMQQILEISKRLLVVYQQLIQARITNDINTYRQNLDKIKKLRIEEKGLYSRIDKKNLSSIIDEMSINFGNKYSNYSEEEKLIHNRIIENLHIESVSIITPSKEQIFSNLCVSEKSFPTCGDILISVANEINLLNIVFLQDMINENNKYINYVINKKLSNFYIYPLLEDEYIDNDLEVEIPVLSSIFVAYNGGLSKETYDIIKTFPCLDKLNFYVGEFFRKVKKYSENEESLIEYAIILCNVRACLQFMSEKEVDKWQERYTSFLTKITCNSKIISLFNKSFTLYNKDKLKFEMLYPDKYKEKKHI